MAEYHHRNTDQEPPAPTACGADRTGGSRRPSTVEGIDMLADEQTKEVLDKIGNSIGHPSLRIVVVGKTGVGKSTLIYGLFEMVEGQTIGKLPRTNTVTPREMVISSPSGQPITVTVTDTPGTEALVGVGKKASCKVYLKEVSGAYKEADIVLFCVRMDDDVRQEEVEMIRVLLKEFGITMWAKVIFVLTFANRVTVDVPDEHKKEVYSEQLIAMQQALQEAMQQARIAEDVAKATPICVAGHPVNKQLPDCPDWAWPFLVNCLKSGIAENTKAALLKSTWKRWIFTPGRAFTGATGLTGIVTGIGLIVVGGVISGTPVTLPLGLPLAAIGTGITLYSASAATAHTVVSARDHKSDMNITKRIQDLQSGGNV